MPTVLSLVLLDHIPYTFALQLAFVLLLMVVGVLGVMVLVRAFQLLGVHTALAKQRLTQSSSAVKIAVHQAEG